MREVTAVVEGVTEAVEPVIAALGLELYDVEITGSGRSTVVRVLVDRPGGIDLDAVGEAAEAISPALDDPLVARSLPGPYSLEVSSPGLERPLRRPEHFRRAVGSTVSVKLPGRRVRGLLTGADDDGIDVQLEHGATERLAYAEIRGARTVFEWGATKTAR